jgi:predicted hydrolase (HD superfamily)
MNMLTLDKAKALYSGEVTQPHLIAHAVSVMAAMGAMARHFGEDEEHWKAIGYLHDYDYEKYPDEHLRHTEQPLFAAGLEPAEVRAIMAHGWGICSDVEPVTNCEKSLYTVDELTGIIGACARMRPNGLSDLTVQSFMKKFKDKKFAAKCDRELIKKGCEMLGMDVPQAAGICIDGMRPYAKELGLEGTAHQS